MPNSASSVRGTSRKTRPIEPARSRPMRAVAHTPSTARSGRPAPRFWPATVAAAPISPTEVQVISENSWL